MKTDTYRSKLSLSKKQENLERDNDKETERIRVEIVGLKKIYVDKYGQPDAVDGISTDGIVRQNRV